MMDFEVLIPEVIRNELLMADWYALDEWTIERAILLGSVFSLYPSGKYYTAFACSNLEICPKCGGNGSLSNPKRDPKANAVYKKYRLELSKDVVAKYGGWANGGWPEEVLKKVARLDSLIEGSESSIECPKCHGLGSEEAYLDQQFRDQLELEASAMGLYIRESEGDPCDILIAQCMDLPSECEHCSSTNTEWLQYTTIECYDCGKETEFKPEDIHYVTEEDHVSDP